MAVPVTDRSSADFSSLGIIAAAKLGLLDSRFNTSTAVQFIPNMDGFPNGRRLEDDVTTIELQAVSGVALAAIGLWYDDYTVGGSPVTTDLTNVLGFNAGVTHNDTTFKSCFPYVQDPWPGFTGSEYSGPTEGVTNLNINTPVIAMNAFPNPFSSQVSFRYKLDVAGKVNIQVTDITGRVVSMIEPGNKTPGDYTQQMNTAALAPGNYIAVLSLDGQKVQSLKIVKIH